MLVRRRPEARVGVLVRHAPLQALQERAVSALYGVSDLVRLSTGEDKLELAGIASPGGEQRMVRGVKAGVLPATNDPVP